jgi:hypothetical protein
MSIVLPRHCFGLNIFRSIIPATKRSSSPSSMTATAIFCATRCVLIWAPDKTD